MERTKENIKLAELFKKQQSSFCEMKYELQYNATEFANWHSPSGKGRSKM